VPRILRPDRKPVTQQHCGSSRTSRRAEIQVTLQRQRARSERAVHAVASR